MQKHESLNSNVMSNLDYILADAKCNFCLCMYLLGISNVFTKYIFLFFFSARLNDLCTEGLETCYFLDFLGPRGFALELSKRTSCK